MTRVYIPLFIHLLIVAGIATGMMVLSWWVGIKRPSKEKLSPYECGIPPVGDARGTITVSFYLIGMLFILFDVEAVFLYPWAVVFRTLRWSGFVEMALYIAILMVGYVYIWKKGALDWTR
jgi:NADH-quinone oxidoreductase subunit A